jgi:hypothetical protein
MHSDAEVSQVGLVLEGFFSISKVRRSQFSHRLSPGLSRRRPEAFNIWMVVGDDGEFARLFGSARVFTLRD